MALYWYGYSRLNENLVKIWQHWYHLLFAIFSIIEAAAVPGHIQCAADLLYVIVLPIAHACKLGVQRMAAALRSSNIMVAARRRDVAAATCGGGDTETASCARQHHVKGT